jgi:hypothetical protein
VELQRRTRLRVGSRRLLLLKETLIWLVLAGALLIAWHYGLLHEVWRSDGTGLSLGVTLIFAGTAVHGSWHVLRLSRALHHMNDLEQYVQRHGHLAFLRGTELPGPHPGFPDGPLAEHMRDLRQKAEIGGRSGRLDQGPLLDALEADLRRGQEFGWLVADLLLLLGPLGAGIGFILMLGPISGLVTSDGSAMTGVSALMSGGMAVALYTILAGLIGGVLLKLQCLVLDGAVQEVIGRTIRLTEVFVLPALQRSGRLEMAGRLPEKAR